MASNKFNIETKVPAREGVPKKDLNHNELVYTEEWNQLVLDAKQLDSEVQQLGSDLGTVSQAANTAGETAAQALQEAQGVRGGNTTDTLQSLRTDLELALTSGDIDPAKFQEVLTVIEKINTDSELKAVVETALGITDYYKNTTVATYAAAQAEATGAQKKIITVLADETDGGSRNRYWYEGDGVFNDDNLIW